MQTRLFVIGLDAATLGLLEPWFRAGKLPNLAEIHRTGVHGPLESIIPPMSAQAWTSLATGKNPGKHGIFDFIQFLPGSYDIHFCNGGTRRTPSLWRILSDAGKTVGVMNVPMTYPPEPVNGFLISGMETPGVHSTYTSPPELANELRRVVGEYHLHGDHYTRHGPDAFLESVFAMIDSQVAACKYLLRRDRWDFFFTVLTPTDKVQHFFWHYRDRTHPLHTAEGEARYGDAIFRVYDRIDRAIGEYRALVPDDTVVMVVSDHGAGPYYRIVYLDRWLAQQGFLHYKEREGPSGRQLTFELSRTGYVRLRKYLPRSVKDWLKSTFPETRRKIESHLTMSQIDWARTKAFSIGIESTRVFINRTDRFPQGTVRPGREYETLRDELIEKLLALQDPQTGQRVAERVYRAEDLYHGECMDGAADLVVLWKNSEYITRRSYGVDRGGRQAAIIDDDYRAGDIGELMTLVQTATHRMDGVVMLTGGPIESGKRLEGARLVDIAPTVLYLLGLPVPTDMDGTVLKGAIRKPYLEAHPVRYADAAARGDGGTSTDGGDGGDGGYSRDEAEVVEDRLKALGYLE